MREAYQFPFHEISIAVFAASFRSGPPPRRLSAEADRTGVMDGHQVVVNTLIQSAASAGLGPVPRDTPMLSGVLADFLSQLIDFGTHRQVLKGHDLGISIERILRNGSVSSRRTRSAIRLSLIEPDDSKTDDLPLIRASSMVSGLAPLRPVLFAIGYRRADVLILEEPEAHLHPANQTALARENVRVEQRVVRRGHYYGEGVAAGWPVSRNLRAQSRRSRTSTGRECRLTAVRRCPRRMSGDSLVSAKPQATRFGS